MASYTQTGIEMLARTAADIGQIIQQARLAQKLSQSELGKRAGLHQPKVSAIERGASGVSVDTILRVMSALRLSINIVDAASAEHQATVVDANEPDYDDTFDLDAIANTGIKK